MTKLKIPDGYTEPTVTNLKFVYPVVKGHVDIPKEHVHDGLFAMGFTHAEQETHETKAVKASAPEIQKG